MGYPCTKCGACCDAGVGKGLMPAGDDGHCIHMVDRECTIYEDRPGICRVKLEDYDRTISMCNDLQIRQGIPVEFRVT